MTTWDPGWPGWSDHRRRVEIENEDGTRLTGVLDYTDTFHDGSDEFPMWEVWDENDEPVLSFVDAARWRFIGAKPA